MLSLPAPTVRRVPASVVRPLRTRVLRSTWADRMATYDQDETVAIHVAAYRAGESEPDGVGTVYAQPPPDANRDEIPGWAYEPDVAWRLRGMATSDAARGTGLGRLVLEACFDAIQESGGRVLWCNARIDAVRFYERLGLACVGPEFDMPEIGPHFVMWREI
ncbi:MAG: GNAT family N-acetyltransferase [Rubricoccaceae bacterium]